ncbi:MAG: hypothetical protein E7311_03105 [Clostridiales bacterium]|nr:hypothetical protein [Clostridiales bacterium]
MLNTNVIRNIKDIEDIKIKLLENITILFKSAEDKEINLKEILENNIELNKNLADKLGIDIEK